MNRLMKFILRASEIERCLTATPSACASRIRRAHADGVGVKQSNDGRRGGLALMVVLVALAIVSAIAMSLLKSAISQHRQAAREVLVAQARWLAESGIDRAAALLKSDHKTEGFQWSVTAEQLGSRDAAKVTIEIKSVENAPQRRQIIAATEYPAESPKRIRTTATRFVDL